MYQNTFGRSGYSPSESYRGDNESLWQTLMSIKWTFHSAMIALVIVAAFVPAVYQAFSYMRYREVVYPEVPLMTEQQIMAEAESVKQTYNRAETPDEFFTALIAQNRLDRIIAKFAGEYGRAASFQFDVVQRQVNARMSGTSDMLGSEFGIPVMAQARDKQKLALDGKVIEPNTSTFLYLGYGYLWSAFVMFLVFAFRAQTLKQLIGEFVSLRIFLASFLWAFFAEEYMTKGSVLFKDTRTMMRFAAFNMTCFMAMCMSFATPKVNAQSSKKGQGKRSNVVIIDGTTEIEGGKNPELGVILISKEGKTSLNSATFVTENKLTQLAFVGRDFAEFGSTESSVKLSAYGGWRGDFEKDTPQKHRFFAGVATYAKQKLTNSRDLVVNVPFAQVEQYVKPKRKIGFFNIGQVFVQEKEPALRYGLEYSFRKDQGSPSSFRAGPMFGWKYKRARFEAWVGLKNKAQTTFRLRTVFAF